MKQFHITCGNRFETWEVKTTHLVEEDVAHSLGVSEHGYELALLLDALDKLSGAPGDDEVNVLVHLEEVTDGFAGGHHGHGVGATEVSQRLFHDPHQGLVSIASLFATLCKMSRIMTAIRFSCRRTLTPFNDPYFTCICLLLNVAQGQARLDQTT